MKRTIKSIFTFILIGIIIGFINTLLVYEGFWLHFNKGLGSVHFIIHLLYGFSGLFLAILAHEMGHFIAFKKMGIKPKAIYVLGIAFVREERWKIRFVPKFLLLIGGIVIPEHLTIKNKDEEDLMVKRFKYVLLAGPKASIIYGVLIFILWLSLLFTNVYWLNGLLFTVMVMTVLMTILAVLSSRISRAGMYGDFAAEKAFETDKLFRLTYLIQLTTLIEHDKESMDYFWPQMVEMLEKLHHRHGGLYANLLGQYIYEVAFEGRIACMSIEKKLNSLVRNVPKTEDGLIMYINIIYYYESVGQKDVVLRLLNQLDTSKFKVDEKVLIYYLRLTNHLLNIKDETNFLKDAKNIHSSSLAWVYKPLKLEETIKDIVR